MALDPARLDPATIYVAGPTLASYWLVPGPLLLCLSIGAILLVFRNRLVFQALLALFSLFGLIVLDFALLMKVLADGPQTMVMGRWLPPFGIAFTVDTMGALLALSSAFVALAVGLYTLYDINPGERRHGFYPLLMLMMAGVSGALTTGDIFNLYVWFEVLLISCFGLLILGGRREQLDGAIKYGLLNLVATTLFLIAVGYLYAIFGTLNMADLATKAKTVTSQAPMVTLAGLFFLAFAMKAAAFPLNFWLPAAYHTPATTVSALFAGILTKVGIYALYRTLVMIFPAGREDLAGLIGVVAMVTMMLGALGALGQQDIRRLFGQVVIAGIGLMLAGLALGTEQSLSAGLFYAVQSMSAMAALYVLAGLAGRIGGSHSLHTLSGLWAKSPLLSIMAILLLMTVSGLPPLSGFWPKFILLGEAFKAGRPWLGTAILVSGLLVTIAMARVILFAFWRERESEPGLEPVLVNGNQMIGHRHRLGMLSLAILLIVPIAMGVAPEGALRITLDAARGLLEPGAYLASVFAGVTP